MAEACRMRLVLGRWPMGTLGTSFPGTDEWLVWWEQRGPGEKQEGGEEGASAKT